MKRRRRSLQLQLLCIGDSPDGGWGARPDVRPEVHALSSGMSPLVDSPRLAPETDGEVVILETRTTLFAAAAGWRPAINAYRCEGKFVVFADLAGVPPDSIKLQVSAERLVIRGTRPAPEPDGQASDTCQLLALEIDHGNFARALDLPQAANPDDVTVEARDGLYRIAIGLKT